MSDNENSRGTADLSKIRSRSYEIPRNVGSSNAVDTNRRHTHFLDDTASPNSKTVPNTNTSRFNNNGRPRSARFSSRPKINSRSTSFASVAAKRRSLARTISSFSVYSHFAGEHLDETPEETRRHSQILTEKRNSFATGSTDFKHEEAAIGEEIEDVSDQPPKASVGKAMFMFLKAFIGSGVLFIPKAFQNGGLALSIVLMLVIGLICLYAFLQLVKTQQIIGGSYGDMGGILYGKFLRYIVLFFLVISQIGFVCSYFIFISGNLVNVVDVLSNCTAGIEQKYYIWMPLVILIPLSLIRHIAKLSFTALIADVFILFGLICIVYFTAAELSTHGAGPNVVAVNPANFALMIGTATFSFEGIGLVIPIVESMERPNKFPFVLILGMIIVCVIYILIGTLSYLAYGDTVQSAVVYNFPPDNRLTISVQLLYSLAICLSAPLVLFPATKITENALFFRFKSGRDSLAVKWSKNVYRIILCIVCAAIAFGIGGDNLDKFVALVGSVACVPLCFIFPGLFHLKVTKKAMDKVWDTLLVLFGVGIMIYTLYVNINGWVHPAPAVETPASYCASRA